MSFRPGGDVFEQAISDPDVPANGLEPADIKDIPRTLYGLHAILRLHFDQEEELYASLERS